MSIHSSISLKAQTRIILREQTLPETDWLERLGMVVSARYENALTLLKTGNERMIAKGEMLVREYENQLTLLADYFADVKEVMQ